MKLFISPHNDDEVLWGAYTLMREKPLVLLVTDSWIQWNRGELNCSANDRWRETLAAMKILDCAVFRGKIRDDIINGWHVSELLDKFHGFDTVYAPAVQGGNPHHDLIGEVALRIFGDKVVFYTTYTKTETYTTGREEIAPSEVEYEKKLKVLECYTSQLNNTNKLYFDAVKQGRSEWYL